MRHVDVVLDSWSSSDQDRPRYYLSKVIEDIIGVAVFYANVPFTYHILDTSNNTFTIDGQTVSIEPGSYHANNLPLIMQPLFETVTGNPFHVYVDHTTLKLTIYTFIAPFTIVTPSSWETPHPLGWNAGSTYTATLRTFYDNDQCEIQAYMLESPRTVNLTGPNQMYLHSSLGSIMYGGVDNGTEEHDIIGFWPVNCNYQGMIQFFHTSPEMHTVTRTQIDQLDFYLTLGTRRRYQQGQSHLSLQGESFQIGIRFFLFDKLIQQPNLDDHGTRTNSADQPEPKLLQSRKLRRLPQRPVIASSKYR